MFEMPIKSLVLTLKIVMMYFWCVSFAYFSSVCCSCYWLPMSWHRSFRVLKTHADSVFLRMKSVFAHPATAAILVSAKVSVHLQFFTFGLRPQRVRSLPTETHATWQPAGTLSLSSSEAVARNCVLCLSRVKWSLFAGLPCPGGSVNARV